MLDAGEVGLLTSLVSQLGELLDAAGTAGERDVGDDGDPLAEIVGPLDTGEAEDDPVLRRLFPDAYRDDDEAAAEWRRFGRGEVRATKSAAVDAVLRQLRGQDAATIPLDDEHVQPWLAALNDVRLALGARLGITDDGWYDEALRLTDEDPRRSAYAVYDWLTSCQALILDAVG